MVCCSVTTVAVCESELVGQGDSAGLRDRSDEAVGEAVLFDEREAVRDTDVQAVRDTEAVADTNAESDSAAVGEPDVQRVGVWLPVRVGRVDSDADLEVVRETTGVTDADAAPEADNESETYAEIDCGAVGVDPTGAQKGPTLAVDSCVPSMDKNGETDAMVGVPDADSKKDGVFCTVLVTFTVPDGDSDSDADALTDVDEAPAAVSDTPGVTVCDEARDRDCSSVATDADGERELVGHNEGAWLLDRDTVGENDAADAVETRVTTGVADTTEGVLVADDRIVANVAVAVPVRQRVADEVGVTEPDRQAESVRDPRGDKDGVLDKQRDGVLDGVPACVSDGTNDADDDEVTDADATPLKDADEEALTDADNEPVVDASPVATVGDAVPDRQRVDDGDGTTVLDELDEGVRDSHCVGDSVGASD